MFKRGVSMKKLLEILRLHFDNKLSYGQISRICNVSKGSVSNYVNMFISSGIEWPLPVELLDENVLSNKLNPNYQNQTKSEIDFKELHLELKQHKNLTLQLLWEEHRERGEMPISYSHLSRLYREWQSKQSKYMRQAHKGGEKIFVDYSGDTIAIYNKETDKIDYSAQVFVAVLGASNYIYVEATRSQKLCDWTMSHVRMFEYIGGVPELVVLDNLKSGVTKPNRYDPDITPAYYQMLRHYGTAALPARIYTPKDKAKAENGVLIIQRWMIARLRKRKFYSLLELNAELIQLNTQINNKQMKQYKCSRSDLFAQLDKPNLKQLPEQRYTYQEYQKSLVGYDYHIKLKDHYYSVPHTLTRNEVDVWYTAEQVDIYYNNKCVAKHMRSDTINGCTTDINHMPVGHRKYQEMDLDSIKVLAKDVGISTELIVDKIIAESHHEQVACRRSYGFLRLAKKYGKRNLESASQKAIELNIFNYKHVEQILIDAAVAGLDNKQAPLFHGNIRGADYYH